MQVSDTFAVAGAWISSLPVETLDARPSLRIIYAQVLLANGRTEGIEEMLAAAEATLRMRSDDGTDSRPPGPDRRPPSDAGIPAASAGRRHRRGDSERWSFGARKT